MKRVLLFAVVAFLLVGGTALFTSIYRDSPRSHLDLAQEAIDAEEWDEAAAELEQAITRDPSLANASVYFQLGLAHSYLEEYEEAISAYQKAIEFDPDQLASHWHLAMIYLEMGRYADARASLEAYADLTPAGPVQVRSYLDDLESLGY